MSFLLTVTGWLAALALGEVAASCAARAAVPRLRPGQPAAFCRMTALLHGGACAIALTLLGALPAVQGWLLACLLLASDAWLLGGPLVKAARRGKGAVVGPRVLAALAAQAKAGPARLRDDFRALLGLLGRHGEPEAPPVPAAAAAPAARAVPPPREVPSVREDPVLGETPAPADIAAGLASAGVPVPPAWAALCDATGTFEPDSDEDLLIHSAGEAAGILAYAEARRALADTLLHGTGLDPAYVAGHHEFADEFAELAAAVALVDRRFHAIYGALREWVAGGGILPRNAREFFEGGAAPRAGAAGDSEAA